MMMVLDPVEVFGSTPGITYNVKVELDNGNDLVSLSGSLKGSRYGIPYGSLLRESLEVQTSSMWILIMGLG